MGRGRGAPEGGETRVHLWLMHAGAWQKATPHYKASVPQLKTKTLKLKGKENAVPRKVTYSWGRRLESYVPRETNPPEKNKRRENRPFECYGGINSGGRILIRGLVSKLKPQRHKGE